MIRDHLRQVRVRLRDCLDAETGAARQHQPADRLNALGEMLRHVEAAEGELLMLQGEPPALERITYGHIAEALNEAGWADLGRKVYFPFGPQDDRRGVQGTWTLDGHTITVAVLEPDAHRDGQNPRVRFDGQPVTNRAELNAAIEGDLPRLDGLDTLVGLLQAHAARLDGTRRRSVEYIAAQLARHAALAVPGQRTACA